MRFAIAATTMAPSVKALYLRLRRLNAAYMEAEDKRETTAVLQACFGELRTLHALLPADLRTRSWMLSVERHVA
jgi:hypothetical protein